MSTTHLTVGSKAPPLVPGKLRLYSMRFCPYAQRTHLVLDSKKIPYDVVWVNLKAKPEWFLEKNPRGTVPTIELEDGTILYESLIITDYLEEAYPEHPLSPASPLQKAKDKLLIEQFNSVIAALRKIYTGSPLKREVFDEFLNSLEIFSKELVARGTPYFGGKYPGTVDLMIWPWIERIDLIKVIEGDQFVLPRERFLRLLEWTNALKEDKAVQRSYLDGEVHAKFITSYIAGTPQYDFLIAE